MPDLDPLYRQAGVVISPLPVGSGLKVKLVEALSRGKATVATSATLEGIADATGTAVTVADAAGDFAGSTLRLLSDRDLRVRKGQDALDIARRHFSAEACYADLHRYIEQPLQSVLPSKSSMLNRSTEG